MTTETKPEVSYPKWMTSLGRVYRKQGISIFLEVPLSDFDKVMDRIRRHGITTVNAISGYDSGKDIEVLYHFVYRGIVMTIKVRVSRKKPSIPSVVNLFPSAILFEQENHEMLGMEFKGNPNLKPLLLGKESPETPLKKKEADDVKGKA